MEARFTIFDETITEVQTVLAHAAIFEGTIVAFYDEDSDVHMMYNLPPGYSIIKEDA